MKIEYKPREYKELVAKLLSENYEVSIKDGISSTFFSAVRDIKIFSNFDEVFKNFVTEFPYSDKMSSEQLKFTFKVLLQQQLSSYWYAGFKTYKNALEIYNDQSLIYLDKSKIKFRYLKGNRKDCKISIIRKIFLRAINSPLKYCSGLKYPYSTEAMYNFLNRLCQDLKIPLTVTCILRSQEFQNSLIKNGKISPNDSSHLYGYTVDIEQKWLRQNRYKSFLKVTRHLQDLENRGEISFIDYGHLWHICLSPSMISYYLK